jgi:hypothetical protein
MIESSLVWLALLVSALVVLFLLLTVIILHKVKSRGRDRAGARQLAGRIVERGEQASAWPLFLRHRFGVEGKQLKAAQQEVDLAEKQFFHQLLQIYLKKDAPALASFDEDLDNLIECYRHLVPDQDQPALDEEQLDRVNIQAVQIEALEEQNQQLVEELSITKRTMESMIKEFSNLFGSGQGRDMEQSPAPRSAAQRTGSTAERVKPGEFELDGDVDIEIYSGDDAIEVAAQVTADASRRNALDDEPSDDDINALLR